MCIPLRSNTRFFFFWLYNRYEYLYSADTINRLACLLYPILLLISFSSLSLFSLQTKSEDDYYEYKAIIDRNDRMVYKGERRK